MLITAAIVAAIAVSLIGIGIIWANPHRSINRAVFLCSLHVAGWLALLHITITADDGLFWLRYSCLVGAMLPVHLWCVKETIANETLTWIRPKWQTLLVWVCLTLPLAIVPFTDLFIPSHSRPDARLFGKGYYAYMVGVIGLYGALCWGTYRQIKRLIGIRRLELQVWLFGGSGAAITVILLMAANSFLHEPALIRLQPFVVMIFFGGTVVAITLHRVFDARQLLLVGLQKLCLIGSVATVAFVIDYVLKGVVAEPLAFLITTGIVLWFVTTMIAWLDRVFHFYPQAEVARQAAFSAAQRETRPENLQRAFAALLRGWGQTEKTMILVGEKDALTGEGIQLEKDGTVTKAIRQLRWATPERLSRERATTEREALREFLAEHNFGVLVIEEGPALTVLIGVGVAASRRPYTYPQVTQLMELVSIMVSALERAHFSAKVQHTEQLATVGLLGASLAHEIRNPLVSIKTFVQLLPTHHQDPAFREKFFRLIGDEVGRIDQLTEQLLDLAAPRAYTAQVIELHPVLRSSLDLVAAKASHRSVKFLTDFSASPDHAYTDASAAKQVMLNLCFNALQAVEQGDADRWVRIATRNTPSGIEMAVADSGPGIAAEIRPRLFQPFQTTKSSGFGLGLAICSDILANLNASITVDPPSPGVGATFRVTFPCQPLSS